MILIKNKKEVPIATTDLPLTESKNESMSIQSFKETNEIIPIITTGIMKKANATKETK